MKENLYIRIIEFCNKNFSEEFTYNDVMNSEKLNLEVWEKEIINQHFENANLNKRSNPGYGFFDLETIFLASQHVSDYKGKDKKYCINFDAQFKYIDYLELKEARENSKKAFYMSFIAIGIAVLSLLAVIFLPITINNEQLEKVENLKFDSTSIDNNFEKLIESQNALNQTIQEYQEELKSGTGEKVIN